MHVRLPLLPALVAGALAAGLVVGPQVTPSAPAAGTAPAAASAAPAAEPEPPRVAARQRATWPSFDANQGIAVDRDHVYAVDNRTITKHDRRTGRPLLQFAGREGGPVEHLDSGVVVGHRLYAAHSNYPEWPMESSVEVFDTRTMRHVGSHSFGIHRGSLTWLDRHDGAWWATFANYDRVQDGQTEPYGETYNTQVAKLDDAFQVVESWTVPQRILDRFEDMSNSGGSWGPDGRLYLTGHDLPEAYVVRLPAAGSELEWVATVAVPGIQGQGIAWDRTDRRRPTLWGIHRDDSRVVEHAVPFEAVRDPRRHDWQVLRPGSFVP